MKSIITSLFLTIAICTFGQERGLKPVIVNVQGKTTTLYNQSHALLIGISDYTAGWPKLPGVKKDVIAVKNALEQNGFNVVVKENLTKDQMDKAFTDFIQQFGQNENNRLLFYFAGHGHTVKTTYGEVIGYIVPADAPNPNYDMAGFQSKGMPMSRIEEYAKSAQSKHAMFLFDACFSGSLFAITRALPEDISYKTTNPVRQFITSGSEDEKVPDESVFRQQFVMALTTPYADANKDNYLTGTELGMYLQDNVINYSNGGQHPQYGKIRNQFLDKGDFVFIISSPETNGKFIITSEFAGELFIDNNYVKDVLNNKQYTESLKAGNHLIEIRSTNENWKQNISIAKDQNLTLKAVAKRIVYGTLVLNSEISGELWIDNINIKDIIAFKTYNEALTEGSHKIEIRGNESFFETITITANGNYTLSPKTAKRSIDYDADAWNTASAINTCSSYTTYLTHYPYRKYATQATEKKNLLCAPTFANFTEPNTNMQLLAILGGSFKMGSNERDDEKPIHTVTVDNFYMGKYEVTNAEYCKFLTDYGTDKVKSGEYKDQTMIYDSKTEYSGNYNWGVNKNGNTWSPVSGKENFPVIYVTWYGANEYGNWLSSKTGQKWRLPTEAEWEYAAHGNENYKYAGSDNYNEVAECYENNNKSTKPVGGKKPNKFGLYDMSGNVWEWCSDWYHSNYEGAPTNGSSWENPVGSGRVLRGGSWDADASSCRVANRRNNSPDNRGSLIGFRLVRVP